ncbi:MAG: recombinase family protein [Rhodobacteraceae bacterium]|jgi:DNA invertase Pin-like site-specific DNA recombinase|nr:recombinase family protein [Paracoccaceae bacterium]MCZ8082718.1 recombinase family protein [Paracoccaceae bacterium]
MNNYMNLKQKALGYARISTNLQGERDDSLERQAARIRQAVNDNGWVLLGIHDDVASAVGKDSLLERPGLRNALEHAAREDAFIVVTEPTRLFRNRLYGLQLLRESGAKVYSLKDQCFISRTKLGEAFRAGEEQAKVTREATSKAMTKSARSSRPNSKASENSSASRKFRSEEIAEQIADILEQDPSLEKLKHSDFAEALNLRGLRSGWGRKWNAESVRDRRARATEILLVRKELAAEEDVFSPTGSPPVRFSRTTSERAVNTPAAHKKQTVNADEPEVVKFGDHRDNPLFGLF